MTTKARWLLERNRERQKRERMHEAERAQEREIAELLSEVPYRNEAEAWRELKSAEQLLVEALRYGVKAQPRDIERLRAVVAGIRERRGLRAGGVAEGASGGCSGERRREGE